MVEPVAFSGAKSFELKAANPFIRFSPPKKPLFFLKNSASFLEPSSASTVEANIFLTSGGTFSKTSAIISSRLSRYFIFSVAFSASLKCFAYCACSFFAILF